MPRPHYPTTGGPHLPSWNSADARKRHRQQTPTTSVIREAKAGQVQPLEITKHASASVTLRGAELNSLANISATKLPGASDSLLTSPLPRNHSVVPAAMMWVAAFLSCLALLFTVLVLLHQG